MKTPAAILIGMVLVAATGCGVVGSASIEREAGWLTAAEVPVVRQKGEADCGAAALAMVLSSLSRPVTLEEIIAACPGSEPGIRAADLRDVARREGLKAFVIAGTVDDLERELGKHRPILVGLVKGEGQRRTCHYEVVVGLNLERCQVALLDPARGWRRDDLDRFASEWRPAGQLALVVFRAADGDSGVDASAVPR
jgi:ABC-type bacteriocin/lantibiotic exporter with double-glycine peptidase domain